MIPVSPNKRTTLVLNSHHLSYGRFTTARRTMQLMVKGRVKGIDASGTDISWTGVDLSNLSGPGSDYSWQEGTVQLYPDQPCLRSAPNALTGEETQWAVPTMIVCTYHLGFPQRKGSSVSLRTLYHMSKGICEYCGDKIPFQEATKDHVYPRDLGGSNDDFNLVLACRSCNSKKSNTYPYYTSEGKLPAGVSIHSFLAHMYEGIDIRPEWEPYLYQR
jgi:5-methylcytosine-specific restriction endonuclease McrA